MSEVKAVPLVRSSGNHRHSGPTGDESFRVPGLEAPRLANWSVRRMLHGSPSYFDRFKAGCMTEGARPPGLGGDPESEASLPDVAGAGWPVVEEQPATDIMAAPRTSATVLSLTTGCLRCCGCCAPGYRRNRAPLPANSGCGCAALSLPVCLPIRNRLGPHRRPV